ncbi:MAG: HNH endonuclease [Rhodospirillales bacterium]
MPIKLVVAVTDYGWFLQLRERADIAEVNFWAPSGERPFRALQPGELFLFKLKAPHNAIVGGGVFVYANTMPCSLAWDTFQEANGARSLPEMRQRIARLRNSNPGDRSDFLIGCRILAQPFFLNDRDWISVPESWSRTIVSFKTYSTDETDGAALWHQVQDHMEQTERRSFGARDPRQRYGDPVLVKPRLGQGAFRILVTDLYNRRCTITGERTLPALEAAHIRPFGEGGDHEPTNGLLLRRDIHRLFDRGYVTVTPDLQFMVSRRIREEYENGRAYYELSGRPIVPPKRADQQPDESALRWHNTEIFLG